MPETPEYYTLDAGHDLYTVWQEHYGHDATAQHLEMAALEYLWRCRHKGQYRKDLEKVQRIVARLLAWTAPDVDPLAHLTLDDALHVLAQHGYGVIPPPLPPREDTERASVDHTRMADCLTVEAEDADTTVLAHCLRVDQQRQGVAVEVEIAQHLHGWQIPCYGRYALWATDLARVSNGHYPVEGA